MPNITIYSTRTCPYCHMLKNFLTSKKVAYKEVLIDTDAEGAKAALDTCGSMAVPCTHIKLDNGQEEKILGFDKARFSELLGLQ